MSTHWLVRRLQVWPSSHASLPRVHSTHSPLSWWQTLRPSVRPAQWSSLVQPVQVPSTHWPCSAEQSLVSRHWTHWPSTQNCSSPPHSGSQTTAASMPPSGGPPSGPLSSLTPESTGSGTHSPRSSSTVPGPQLSPVSAQPANPRATMSKGAMRDFMFDLPSKQERDSEGTRQLQGRRVGGDHGRDLEGLRRQEDDAADHRRSPDAQQDAALDAEGDLGPAPARRQAAVLHAVVDPRQGVDRRDER